VVAVGAVVGAFDGANVQMPHTNGHTSPSVALKEETNTSLSAQPIAAQLGLSPG
jgi:hypothetical protein